MVQSCQGAISIVDRLEGAKESRKRLGGMSLAPVAREKIQEVLPQKE